MATRYNHIQLGVVNANGDVDVLYPQTTARDVAVDKSNSKIPHNVDDLQELVSSFGEMAFENKDKLVFLGESEEYNGNIMETEINDDYVGEGFTWSSKKIANSTNTWVNNNDARVRDLTTLFLAPKTISVDGTIATFSAICPGAGYHWIMEYFPLIIENNTVIKAVQRWTGFYPHGALSSVYYRSYLHGEWSLFNEQ